MYYVYMLRCQDESLYTGITNNLDKRFSQHKHATKQAAKYTKAHPVLYIAAYWLCEDKKQASRLEYWLKKLNKAQKEEIIQDNTYFNQYLSQHIDCTDYERGKNMKTIEVLFHSSIRIEDQYVFYIDPYEIKEEPHNADYILITHSHYDHYSTDDIIKVMNDKTHIFVTKDIADDITSLGFSPDHIHCIEPCTTYRENDVTIETIPAYNTHASFHPKDNQWVGYVICVNNQRYYIAGDTNMHEDNQNIHCDVAFIPVGGTYTMDAQEAAKLANIIKPQYVVPTHYGSVVGDKEDGQRFKQLVASSICLCLLDTKEKYEL